MMVVNGRGKLGGHVLTKARSGATVRTRVTPSNPQTSAQGLVRGIFSSMSQAWRNLTEEQRIAWNSAVDSYMRTNVFGDSYAPSGKNLFVSLNTNLLNIEQSQISNPPVQVDVPSYIAESVEIALPIGGALPVQGKVTFDFVTDLPGSAFDIVIEATQPFSAGKFNFSGAYRKIGVYAGDVVATPESIYQNYTDKFGDISEGKKISFRIKVVSKTSGQVSPWSSVAGISFQPV